MKLKLSKMAEVTEYVHADEAGALRVGGGQIMLESVLTAWAQGHSPETIRSQYPALTLEEVYGAIAWSLAHSEQTTAYLNKQNLAWESWRERLDTQNTELRQRVRQAHLPSGPRL